VAQTQRITGTHLLEGERWDPHLYCGHAATALLTRGRRQTLSELGAVCVDGLRDDVPADRLVQATLFDGPLYQVGNLEPLRFRLDREQWRSPTDVEHPACVDPGDVVVKKTAPVVAAWAGRGLPRHPADVNCILIKWQKPPADDSGLETFAAARERHTQTAQFWVALCLNQPEYEEVLLRTSGATVLPRIRVAVLRELTVPTPPPEAEPLAARAWELNEQFLDNAKELNWLVDVVDDNIRQFIPESDEPDTTDAPSWGRFFPAADVSDSLIPRHVAQGHLQHTLRDQRRWVTLPELLGPRQPSRKRRTEVDPDDVYLRLSDIGDDMTIPGGSRTEAAPMPGRVFAEPVAPDEVMLSLLATSPRVAFAGVLPGGDVYAVDHWERLSFRETPGAWALALASESTRRQIRLLAMGTFQQFAHPESLAGLVLPPLDDELRRKWDRQLRRYQDRQQKLRQSWQELWDEALALYRRAHPGVAPRDRSHDTRGVRPTGRNAPAAAAAAQPPA
jgi:hypothetical protein